MDDRKQFFIDGRWTEPFGTESIAVINPATEEVVARVPEALAEDIDAAVAAARKALPGWAATPPQERADWLEKLHAALNDRLDETARTITVEMGMPLKLAAKIQVGLPLLTLQSYARLVRDYPFEEEIAGSPVLREPAGVVACITPWNFPLHQIMLKVAPALAAGCTVVLKPSETAPLNAFSLAELVDQVGLPAGVFNLVSGNGPTVGEALAGHPQVDMVSFTGSIRAGKRISMLAAETIKRVTLELGGKSPSVILPDADLAKAVKGTVNNCLLNSGQTCSATTRMLVPETCYEDAAKLAVELAQGFSLGDPLAGSAKLGPLVSDRQRDTVRAYIRKGSAEGAELLAGGPEQPEGLKRGYYVKPTVFGRVTPKMTIAREEIFGPVLSIMTYRDEDEAVALANDTVYGLAAAVWSEDRDHAIAIARRIRAGQVEIDGGRFNPLVPFGGCKQSGNGREGGRFGLEEFLEVKALLV